jgi:hypothetical protein
LASSWISELKLVAYKSVSFTNGCINKTCKNNDSNNYDESNDENYLGGKPHNVEVRAALILFHSVLRGGGGGERKNRRTRWTEWNHYLATNECGCDDSNGGGTARYGGTTTDDVTAVSRGDLDNDEVGDGQGEATFEIVSDMGTGRLIDSVRSLATLLSAELEIELCNVRDHAFTSRSHNFLDIRPNESGIVHLISQQSYNQLRSCGRLPCPHCTSWLMGSRGLWWHCLQVHNVKYSDATESAATVNGDSSMAIVPYEMVASLDMMKRKEEQHPQQQQH